MSVCVDMLTGNVLHSRSVHNVIRHSSRQRVAPLKWWANERILLCPPFSGTLAVVSGHSPELHSPTDTVIADAAHIFVAAINNRHIIKKTFSCFLIVYLFLASMFGLFTASASIDYC